MNSKTLVATVVVGGILGWVLGGLTYNPVGRPLLSMLFGGDSEQEVASEKPARPENPFKKACEDLGQSSSFFGDYYVLDGVDGKRLVRVSSFLHCEVQVCYGLSDKEAKEAQELIRSRQLGGLWWIEGCHLRQIIKFEDGDCAGFAREDKLDKISMYPREGDLVVFASDMDGPTLERINSIYLSLLRDLKVPVDARRAESDRERESRINAANRAMDNILDVNRP